SPPPAYTPRPAKDYTPPPSGRSKQASYTKLRAPEVEPMVMRGSLPPPQGRHIQVAKGDTLPSLSRQYYVSTDQIMSANNLPDGHLQLGQALIIPGARGKPTETKERVAPPAVAAKQTQPATPRDKPNVHVVKTTTIPAPGTSLAEEEAQQAAKAGGAPKKDTPPIAPISASNETTGPSGTGSSTPSTPHVATNQPLPPPDPMSGNSFRWPVRGRVVSGFGTKPGGGNNSAIDLAGPQRTSV